MTANLPIKDIPSKLAALLCRQGTTHRFFKMTILFVLLGGCGVSFESRIVMLNLHGGDVGSCQQKGYSGYPYLLAMNQASFPVSISINGEPVNFICDDGRLFMQIPPGGAAKIMVDDTATSVSFFIKETNMIVSPPLLIRSGTYPLIVQESTVTDQTFLQTYGERYQKLLVMKEKGATPINMKQYRWSQTK